MKYLLLLALAGCAGAPDYVQVSETGSKIVHCQNVGRALKTYAAYAACMKEAGLE